MSKNDKKLSHNIYSDNSEETKDINGNKIRYKLPNYLIQVDRKDINGTIVQCMIPCTCINKVLEKVREKKAMCTIYESITSKNTHYEYLCDASYGII